jgi:hypothetical protein
MRRMEKIFIAHSFHAYDHDLVQRVGDIVRAFGLVPVTGRRLGGGVLSDEIKARIADADAVIALCTYRADGGSWPTHPWVVREFEYAIDAGKPCISVVDTRVPWDGGPHGAREYIQLNSDSPHAALFDLVDQIGIWRQNAGTPLQLLISEDHSGLLVRDWDDFSLGFSCRLCKADPGIALCARGVSMKLTSIALKDYAWITLIAHSTGGCLRSVPSSTRHVDVRRTSHAVSPPGAAVAARVRGPDRRARIDTTFGMSPVGRSTT